jgi:hypothetical protein
MRDGGIQMTRIIAIALGLMLTGAAQEPPWITLLDGTSLRGWTVVGDANWQVVDGAVQANRGTGFLVTPMSYRNFELHAEIWVDADANSGVFIRCTDPAMITAMNAYEVNIFDKRPDQAYRTGGIVDVAMPKVKVDAGGKWNTLDITAQGNEFSVTMNGTLTADAQDDRLGNGRIALQYGAGTVKFRSVRIRAL